MRPLFAFVAALMFGLQSVHAEEDPNYLYSVSFGGGMTMTRYAKPEYAEGLRTERPVGVNVTWNYRADDEASGDGADQEINAINEVVAKVLKLHPGAVLALTSIRGTKQGIWAFYTSDGQSLAAALESGLKGKTGTPVRVRVGKDPEWRAFNAFLARLREEK